MSRCLGVVSIMVVMTLTTACGATRCEKPERYAGSGEFKVSFQERITTEPGKTHPKANPSILQQGGAYTLLPCDNDLTAFGISEAAYHKAENSDAVKAVTRWVAAIQRARRRTIPIRRFHQSLTRLN